MQDKQGRARQEHDVMVSLDHSQHLYEVVDRVIS